jgi:hypothetical protein
MVRPPARSPSPLAWLALLASCGATAESARGDEAGAERRQVLRITKSENDNYVVYDQVLDASGRLADAPLDVYWVMDGERGQRAELNGFERDIYGVTIERVDRLAGLLVFAINAVRSKRFEVAVAADGAGPEVFTAIDGDSARVTDVHLVVRSTWNPLQPDVEIRLTGETEKPAGMVAVEEVIRR